MREIKVNCIIFQCKDSETSLSEEMTSVQEIIDCFHLLNLHFSKWCSKLMLKATLVCLKFLLKMKSGLLFTLRLLDTWVKSITCSLYGSLCYEACSSMKCSPLSVFCWEISFRCKNVWSPLTVGWSLPYLLIKNLRTYHILLKKSWGCSIESSFLGQNHLQANVN